MGSEKKVLKRIKNVFISTNENYFQLCEIEFDEQIAKITPVTDFQINWKEIDTLDKRSLFIKDFPSTVKKENEIDGEFLILIPGGIDPHVHFNSPGFEEREDFEHASLAAASGGTTTIIDMPCTSLPPITNKANLLNKLKYIENKSYIDYAFFGGVCGNNFSNQQVKHFIKELAEAGVAGYKAYLVSGMQTFTDLDKVQMLFAAKVIAKTGKPLLVHAEDKNLVIGRQKYFQYQLKNDWEDYCKARDVEAEVEAVKTMISIAESTKCKIHIVHLSSAKAIELIRNAHRKNISISAETCPHYLHFTQKDFQNASIKNFLKTAPPVKNEEDKNALWEALADNTISFVTTDHAGCNPLKEKSSTNFWDVYGGIPGVEHRVAFLLSEGFLKNRISMEKTIQHLSVNAAEFFQLKNKGKIQTGYDADFCLVNLWKSKLVNAEQMHSKGKYTPFEGTTFNALVEKTFLRGNLVVGKIDEHVKKYSGKFLKIN